MTFPKLLARIGLVSIGDLAGNLNTTGRSSDQEQPATIAVSPFWSNPLLRPFASLRHRYYAIYWAAMAAELWAMNMQMFVRSWYAFQLKDQAWVIGAMIVAQGVPTLFLSLYGGALADRFNNRNVLIFGYFISTLATLSVAILIHVDLILWWHLIISAAFAGIGLSLAMGARLAIVSELVAPGEVLNGVSLSNMANNVARIAAPALAGLLLASAIGAGGVFYLMAVFSGLAVVILFFLPVKQRQRRIRSQSVFEDMAEGFSYVRRNEVILWLTLLYLVTATLGMPYLFLLPVLAETAWDASAFQISLIFSMVGIGSLLGSLTTATLGEFRRKGLLLIIVCIGFGLGIVALALSPYYLMALIVAIPLGTFQSGRLSLNPTLVQLQAPEAIRGRVMGIYEFSNGIFPIGVLVISILMDFTDPGWVMGMAGAVMALFCTFVLFTRGSVRQLS